METRVDVPEELKKIVDLLGPVKQALYEASKTQSLPAVIRCIRMTDERLDEAYMWASQAGYLSAVMTPERNTAVEEAISSGKVVQFPQS
jgi:hypothetical protein